MNYVFSLLNTRVPLRQCLQGVTKECLGPVYRHFVWASLVLNLWSHLWRRLSVSEFKFREWKWWVEKEWSDHEFCLSVLLSENSLSDRSFSTIHFHRVNFNWLDHNKDLTYRHYSHFPLLLPVFMVAVRWLIHSFHERISHSTLTATNKTEESDRKWECSGGCLIFNVIAGFHFNEIAH